MALRYRVERAQNGDILDPSPWNLNQKELSGEFNGYLDHDNLPENSVDGDSVVVGAFTQDAGSVNTGALTIDPLTVEWQHLYTVTLDADVDTPVRVEFSGGHKWDQASGGRSYDAVASSQDHIQYQITVDGNTVAETGPLSDDHYWECVDLVGVALLQAGPHTILVSCKVAHLYISCNTGQLFSYCKGIVNGVSGTEGELIVTEELR